MGKIITFLILVLCFFVFFKSRRIWTINRSRRKGFTPAGGKATMFHVRDLLRNGERDHAIQMYCEIFKTHRKEAVRAIAELENSIHNKNS